MFTNFRTKIVNFKSKNIAQYQNFFGGSFLEKKVLVTYVGAPVAWGPRIIDMADTAVATALDRNMIERLLTLYNKATQELLATDLVILNHGQVTRRPDHILSRVKL
ncbi:hypothetical protein TNCV_523701 [Trichonephila clavipes]|nr:hypothetical protein TNCV_523701 [Trichonephila clavipes]